jgi:hypothetical protein
MDVYLYLYRTCTRRSRRPSSRRRSALAEAQTTLDAVSAALKIQLDTLAAVETKVAGAVMTGK